VDFQDSLDMRPAWERTLLRFTAFVISRDCSQLSTPFFFFFGFVIYFLKGKKGESLPYGDQGRQKTAVHNFSKAHK